MVGFSKQAPLMFTQQRQPSIADALLARGLAPTPIEHPFQGYQKLAEALFGALGKRREASQQQEAMKALTQGATARPWVNPDTGQVAPGQTGVGGYEGALHALGGLGDNPVAAQIAQQLTLGKLDQDAMQRAAEQKRAAALEDAKALYKYQQDNKKEPKTAEQRNWETAQKDPGFADFIKKTGANNTPASVQEYNFYKDLPPEQQSQFMLLKRAASTVNLGGTQATINPADPTQNIAERKVTLKPGEQPDVRREQSKQAAIGKTEGETLAAAQADLPQREADAAYMLKLLDDLVAHPGLPEVVGVPDITTAGGRMPGSAGAGFRERLGQIKGRQFLEAFESLKGGGQITEVEGAKAESAIARLGTAQSEKEFIEAAREFQGVITNALNRVREKARGGARSSYGAGAAPPPPAPPPPPGFRVLP